MSQFQSFGDYLISVRNAATIGAKMDLRLLQTRGVPLGASEQVPTDGGFAVPPEFSRQLVERMYLTGGLISRCFQMPIGASNQVSFPQFDESSRANGSRFGGVEAFWQNEADTFIPSKAKLQGSTLTAKKLTGLVYMTEELYMDSAALDIFANAAFANELNFRLEDAIVNGDGAGKPSGILRSNAVIQVAPQSGQTAGTIIGQNIVDIWSRCWAPSRRTAVWLAHPDAEKQVFTATVNVGVAGSELKLYQATHDPENQPYNLVLGRPILPVEYMPTPGNVGDIMLVDLSRYVLAMRETQAAISMHVAFLTDQLAYRVTMRCDGQPIDNRPITPFTGTDTVSPFVAIAQRS